MVDWLDLGPFIEDLFGYLVERFGSFGLIGSILFLIVIMIIQAIIAPIISEAILTASGGIFDQAFPGGLGIAAAIIGGIIGSLLGAYVAFKIARWVQGQAKKRIVDQYGQHEETDDVGLINRSLDRLANFLARFIDEESENFIEIIEERGFIIVLIGRLLPFVPFDAVSYGAGFTLIKFKDFMWATVIGTVPRVIFYVLLGTELGNQLGEGDLANFLYLLTGSVIVILVLYKLTMNYLRKNYGSTDVKEIVQEEIIDSDNENNTSNNVSTKVNKPTTENHTENTETDSVNVVNVSENKSPSSDT